MVGDVDGCFGTELVEGTFLTLHVGMIRAFLSQDAGRQCLHSSTAEQSSRFDNHGGFFTL